MTTKRIRKNKPGPAKPRSDPKALLARLRTRLDKERSSKDRWQKRLLRACHVFERQLHLIARLERRIAKLESA
jgi:hypothetical protein